MPINKDLINNQGYCNGYVVAGKTKEDRKARLNEVPEDMRQDVIRHMKTILAIRTFHENNVKKKKV